MIEFEKINWYDKSDTANRIPISKDNLNRLENTIDALVKFVNKMETHYVKACDVTKLLTTLQPEYGATETWEATEDCWISMYAFGGGTTGSCGTLKINGVDIFDAQFNTNWSHHNSGMLTPPSFFAKKGDTISLTRNTKTGNSNDTYISCNIYGCL